MLHLKDSPDHLGKTLVRVVLDSLESMIMESILLVYQPLGMNFIEVRSLLRWNEFPKALLQRTQLPTPALAFIHENGVIHTGKLVPSGFCICRAVWIDISIYLIQQLQGIKSDSTLSPIENDKVNRPISRKVLGDRTIYYSRPMTVHADLLFLPDFGEARVGNRKHKGDIIPVLYAAPELILDMELDSKVDIWSVGLVVSSSVLVQCLSVF